MYSYHGLNRLLNDEITREIHRLERRRKAEPRLLSKRAASPDRFVALPSHLVDDVGLYITRGRYTGHVKIDLAVLAGFAWFYMINRGRQQDITLPAGDTQSLGKDDFLLSVRTVASNLYQRWFWSAPTGSAFDAFYERIRKIPKALTKNGLLINQGPIRNGSRGRLGTVWTFAGTPIGDAIDACYRTPAGGTLLLRPQAASFEQGKATNVVDLVGGLYMAEQGLAEEFVHVETAHTMGHLRKMRKYKNWIRQAVQKGKPLQAHGTTGLFRKPDFDKEMAPTLFPYVIFEIDRHSTPSNRPFEDGWYDNGPRPLDYDAIRASYEAACRILRSLSQHGCSLEHILCCFSGHKSFHLYLPSGMTGLPVFQDHVIAKKALARFARSVTDETLDENLFSPHHLLRVIGAYREDTKLYKRAFSGSEFLELALYSIIEQCREHTPFRLNNPLLADPVPALVEHMTNAARSPLPKSTYRRVINVDEVATWSDMAQTAWLGCAEGETWWPGHTGRDDLLFCLACYLLDNAGLSYDEAHQVLTEVNARNRPPCQMKVVEKCLRSAQQQIRSV